MFWVRVAIAGLLTLILCAQSPQSRFPPGTFNSRAALDAAPAGGSVSLSATGTKTYTGTAGLTVAYTGITVGGSDTTLMGSVTYDLDSSATPVAPTAIWDVAGANQAMTLKIDSTAGSLTGPATVIFCLQSPVSGNKTLTFAWTVTSTRSFTNALSFTGSATGCQNGAKGGATSTITVTSGTGHIVVGLGDSGGGLGTLTSAGNTCPTGAPTCVVYSDSSSGTNINAFSQIAAGAATVATGSNTTITNLAGVDVAP